MNYKSFSAGTKVSHYEIISEIGKGGMGEVYRAWDTKLKRDVAIKFIHFSHSENLQAKKSFLYESQAQAHINHPEL